MVVKNSKQATKHRYVEFLVYPDSAPAGWINKLKATHGMYAISPLHLPDDEQKKPHYHVIYCHGNSTTDAALIAAALQGEVAQIAANGYAEVCYKPRGAMRYLIHLDDKDKQQWGEGRAAITLLNGFPLDLSREYSKEEMVLFRSRIFEIIREFNIVEYADIIDYLTDHVDEDMDFQPMLDYACNHTILFTAYLTSRREGGKFS